MSKKLLITVGAIVLIGVGSVVIYTQVSRRQAEKDRQAAAEAAEKDAVDALSKMGGRIR
jgi:hypothetical protein